MISAGREAREGTAAGTESGVGTAVVRMRAGKPGGGKGALISRERSLTLAANANDQILFTAAVFDMTHANNPVQSYNSKVCHTLNARMGTGGNQVPVVFEPGACTRTGGHIYSDDKAPTLRANSGDNRLAIAFSIAGNTIDRKPQNGGNGAGWQKDVSYTLNTMDRHAVYSVQRSDEYKKAKVSHTLSARDYKSATDLICKGHVRRLTPLEAERLQGLPDHYTLIDDKSCSDTARYKALGNGMAQPVADWVIERIVEARK